VGLCRVGDEGVPTCPSASPSVTTASVGLVLSPRPPVLPVVLPLPGRGGVGEAVLSLLAMRV
jgi:hypothetical protein